MKPRFNLRVLKIIFKIWNLLDRKRKKQSFCLLILLIFCGLVELISLASVVPFLMVITDPERLLNIGFVKNLFDNLNIISNNQILFITTLLFLSASIFNMIIRVSSLYIQGRFAAEIGSEFSCRVFKISLNKPYLWHIKQNSSEIINDATNNVKFLVLFIRSFLTIFTQLTVAICLLFGLFIFDGLSAVFSGFIFLSAYLLLAFFVRRRIYSNGKFFVLANQRILKMLQEVLGLIREVIMNNMQYQFINSYQKIDNPSRLKEAENEFLKVSPRYVLEAICFSLVAILAYVLTLTKESPSQVIYTLGTLAVGAQKLLPAMQGVYLDWANLKHYYPGTFSVLKIINNQEMYFNEKLFEKKISFKNNVTLENLSFKYTDDDKNNILNQVNFTINKGQRIGIIGETGSGKSTLIDIFMCLLFPQSGAIKIDGKKINFSNKDELNSWRSTISHVPQDIYLLDDSILNNIAFDIDKKNINIDRVYESAKKAMIFEFVKSLPDGFNTFVGERGVRLSGGQKQRLGIARALYKKSQILIFDEATSSLDLKTEKEVMKCLNNLGEENLTIILIAHRLSTLKNCDAVYEVSNSKLKKIDLRND